MVVFGTKSTQLASVKAHDRYCAGCDSYDTIVLNVFRQQLCIFGIPLIPLGKTGNALCQKCKKVFDEETMPELIKHHYLLVKNELKKPSWQIMGSLLLLGIALAFFLTRKKTNQKELKYLASPHEGDVYEYQLDDTEYSTMKIIKVSADSLCVYLNKYKIHTPYRLNKIDKAENYKRETVAFERQKINNMYNKGQILEIKRMMQ